MNVSNIKQAAAKLVYQPILLPLGIQLTYNPALWVTPFYQSPLFLSSGPSIAWPPGSACSEILPVATFPGNVLS